MLRSSVFLALNKYIQRSIIKSKIKIVKWEVYLKTLLEFICTPNLAYVFLLYVLFCSFQISGTIQNCRLYFWFPKYHLHTSSTQELVRNAYLRASSRPTEPKATGVAPGVCASARLPGDGATGYSLEALGHIIGDRSFQISSVTCGALTLRPEAGWSQEIHTLVGSLD